MLGELSCWRVEDFGDGWYACHVARWGFTLGRSALFAVAEAAKLVGWSIEWRKGARRVG